MVNPSNEILGQTNRAPIPMLLDMGSKSVEQAITVCTFLAYTKSYSTKNNANKVTNMFLVHKANTVRTM